MGILAVFTLIVGLIAGSTGAIKKCDKDPKWCHAASEKIKPAPQDDSSGG